MLEDDEVRIRRLLADSREKTRKGRRRLFRKAFTVGCLLGVLTSQSAVYVHTLKTERDLALRQAQASYFYPVRDQGLRHVSAYENRSRFAQQAHRTDQGVDLYRDRIPDIKGL